MEEELEDNKSQMSIGFDLSDIFEYFALKEGKVVYSEIVTFFKKSLSDPATQVQARIKFKDYVNVLATVTIENGKKYLVLKPKYMKKLFNDSSSSLSSLSTIGNNGNLKVIQEENQLPNSPVTTIVTKSNLVIDHHPTPTPSIINNNPHQQLVPISPPPIYNNNTNHHQNNNKTKENNDSCVNYVLSDDSLHSSINNNNASTSITNCNSSNIVLNGNVNNVNNVNNNNNIVNSYNDSHHHHQPHHYPHHSNLLPQISNESIDDVPPRPPPRKKGSFSKSKTRLTPSNSTADSNTVIVNQQQQQQMQQQLNTDTTEPNSTMEPKTNHEVKKEIQELAKTPGRVKEHAQILNKLASASSDFKLPMPLPQSSNSSLSSTNLNSQVANKIRSINHSDTDSGSVQILDALKKRWILAASGCDFNELLSLLKEDSNLSSYCDFILGYSALHWAAKFNKPEIINLIAGQYSVNVNIKSFSGCTPLHIAAQFRNEFIMKLLTQNYGADIDARDNYGKKAHHYLTSIEKKPNQSFVQQEKQSITNDNHHHNKKLVSNGTLNTTSNTNAPAPSATENLRTNLRNKISHQSMLVRNTLRKSKAFQRRKSITSKG